MTACLSAVSASLLVGGRSGLVTKAVMASQSLRISRASARALAASASSLSRQARLRRAMNRMQPAQEFETRPRIEPLEKGPVHRGKIDRRLVRHLSLIHISEPTRLGMISYAVFCLKKKKT